MNKIIYIKNIFFLSAFFSVFLIFFLSCASSPKNTGNSEQKIIAGEVSWDYWKSNAGWAVYDAYDYEPEQAEIDKLKKLLREMDYSFTIFATTFCDECMENLPRLFKVFESSQIPPERYHLFGLDDKLSEPSGEFKKYNISSTPVVFVKVDNIIIGEAAYPYLWLKNFIEIFQKFEENR